MYSNEGGGDVSPNFRTGQQLNLRRGMTRQKNGHDNTIHVHSRENMVVKKHMYVNSYQDEKAIYEWRATTELPMPRLLSWNDDERELHIAQVEGINVWEWQTVDGCYSEMDPAIPPTGITRTAMVYVALVAYQKCTERGLYNLDIKEDNIMIHKVANKKLWPYAATGVDPLVLIDFELSGVIENIYCILPAEYQIFVTRVFMFNVIRSPAHTGHADISLIGCVHICPILYFISVYADLKDLCVQRYMSIDLMFDIVTSMTVWSMGQFALSTLTGYHIDYATILELLIRRRDLMKMSFVPAMALFLAEVNRYTEHFFRVWVHKDLPPFVSPTMLLTIQKMLSTSAAERPAIGDCAAEWGRILGGMDITTPTHHELYYTKRKKISRATIEVFMFQ